MDVVDTLGADWVCPIGGDCRVRLVGHRAAHVARHLAPGSNGGLTFTTAAAPTGAQWALSVWWRWTLPASRSVPWVVPASTHENRTTELMLEHLAAQAVIGRLELVLVDRGSPPPRRGRWVEGTGSRCVGSAGMIKQPVFRPIRHAWRVEVAHRRLGRARRLAKSFENTTASATDWLQVACITMTLRRLSTLTKEPRLVALAA
jgi:putative transposase